MNPVVPRIAAVVAQLTAAARWWANHHRFLPERVAKAVH